MDTITIYSIYLLCIASGIIISDYIIGCIYDRNIFMFGDYVFEKYYDVELGKPQYIVSRRYI